MLYLITLLSLERAAFAHDACGAPPRPHVAERREDFYRIKRLAEARDLARDAGRDEIAGREVDRQRKLEEARQLYIRTRRPKPDDDAGDRAWQATLAERRRRIEDARECYVTQRDRAEAQANHGHGVPEDVEYGLDE